MSIGGSYHRRADPPRGHRHPGWPAPGGLSGFVRRLLGRPEATGTDEMAMRVDASETAARIARGAVPEEGPHPGLVNLARRSDRRIARARARIERRLAQAVGRHADAQAALNRGEGERSAAAAALRTFSPDPVARPVLGTSLTRNVVLIPLLLIVMIPLEALLTYRQLLVLGMSDRTTLIFSALIGVALVVVAEVIAFFIHHTFTHVEGDDDRGRPGWRTPLYWMMTLAAVTLLATSAVTIHRLSEAREINQAIVEERNQRLQELTARVAGEDVGPGASDTADLEDRGRVDLRWSFGLQFLVLLAAVGLGVRKRMAEEYNEVEQDRRARVRRSRRAEISMRRLDRRVTRAASRHDAVERQVRAMVDEERAFLLELFEEVRSRVPAMESRLVPELVPVDEVVNRIFNPDHDPITQTVVGSVPVGRVPPAPAEPSAPAPATPASAPDSHQPDPEPEPTIVSTAPAEAAEPAPAPSRPQPAARSTTHGHAAPAPQPPLRPGEWNWIAAANTYVYVPADGDGPPMPPSVPPTPIDDGPMSDASAAEPITRVADRTAPISAAAAPGVEMTAAPVEADSPVSELDDLGDGAHASGRETLVDETAPASELDDVDTIPIESAPPDVALARSANELVAEHHNDRDRTPDSDEDGPAGESVDTASVHAPAPVDTRQISQLDDPVEPNHEPVFVGATLDPPGTVVADNPYADAIGRVYRITGR